MSIFSNLVRKVSRPVSVLTSIVPDPRFQIASQITGEIARDTAIRNYNRAEEAERNKMINYDFGGPSSSTLQRNLAATTPRISTAASGGGFFDTLRGGIREVGGLVSDIFGTGIPSLLGVGNRRDVITQPAVTTPPSVSGTETSTSGTVDAGAGALLTPLVSGVRNLIRSPIGQIGIGGGVGLLGGLTATPSGGPRITRKMKSQARMVLNMTGGNLAMAADILGIDQNTLVMILLKRFRNDGPVVTKAALRKTKQTIRRLHNMQDVLKSITPTATRRRAPMRRASTTTLIKN
jgi:hypothetical protein